MTQIRYLILRPDAGTVLLHHASELSSLRANGETSSLRHLSALCVSAMSVLLSPQRGFEDQQSQ